jgi:transketolase
MWRIAPVVQPLAPDAHQLVAHALRALAIDAVEAAASGHPGAPMGLADVAAVLFTEVLRHDPGAPGWADRDRFVLSNGHASMLLYACLHLAGYELSMDEIRRFRQLGSKTPGHPEVGITPGVETTTGPLGQGFANAVGMALGRRMAAARFPEAEGFCPVSHRVYGIVGDGCLMEGLSSEAASLAGHLGLGELIFIYDDNGISIDGDVSLAFSEDVEMRFTSMGWHTVRIDGHDPGHIREALATAQAETERPSLILARTLIGYGSPNRAGTGKVHGEALGEEERRLTKAQLGWPHPSFEIPADVYAAFRPLAEAGRAARVDWEAKLRRWRSDPARDAVWRAHHEAPKRLDLDAIIEAAPPKKDATRGLSGRAMNAVAKQTPRLVGGSADLTGSNKTKLEGGGVIGQGAFEGRNLHFGVREHAMAAVVNGLALYGGYIPFGATFLTFSDYMRNALRLAALMKVRALQVFTHDSIGLGEDGPTHQPVEHLWSLRLIPGLSVWRPADAVETAAAWAYAAGEGPEAPHALVFSRQKTPPFERPEGFTPQEVWRGAYPVRAPSDARVALVATGTEVAIALDAADGLAARGVPARVVSMPCVERFLELDEAARAEVLPPGLPRVSVEAGATLPWRAVLGPDTLTLGVDAFGESAPAADVYAHFGLTPEAIADRVLAWVAGR